MGELVLTRNAISDLGLDVKPGRFCFGFLETTLYIVCSAKSECVTAFT
jgi:hypothetical protein